MSHDYTGMIPLNWSNYKKENTYTKLPSLLQDSAGLPIEDSLSVSFSLCDTLTRCSYCPVSLSLSECHGAALVTCCRGRCLVSTAQAPLLPRPAQWRQPRQLGRAPPGALVGWSLPSISQTHCPHVIWISTSKIITRVYIPILLTPDCGLMVTLILILLPDYLRSAGALWWEPETARGALLAG